MEYPDLGVFMCPICMELLTITDNTEAFMVIGPACCRTVIFLLSTNVSAVDFCHTLKCLAGLALIPNDFILTYSNDDFFFSVWGKWSGKKKRKKLFIYCYLCSLIQQDGREWFELMCLMEKLTSCWILVESCFNGIWPSSWVWINTTQNGNLINSKYVLNSLLKGTLEQNKCIWYKPH